MRIAILGRTKQLLRSAQVLQQHGHEIGLVGTCQAEPWYGVDALDYAELARQSGADFLDQASLENASTRARLVSARCEIAVSINWLTMIGPGVLDCFPRGVLNSHAGDLPRYRGNACPNWAILNGETRIGLCVHQMVPALDAGPVVARDYLPIDDATYIGDVYAWLEERSPTLFAEAIALLAHSAFVPQALDLSASLRCYPRRPEDGRIDWRQPATLIHRLIRASSRPLAGAFTTLEGSGRVTIWRAEPVGHDGAFCAVPGQVCYRAGDDPVIACGQGMLRLTEIDADGGKATIHKSLRQRLV